MVRFARREDSLTAGLQDGEVEGRTRREKRSWGPLGLAREQSGLARRASEGTGRQGWA